MLHSEKRLEVNCRRHWFFSWGLIRRTVRNKLVEHFHLALIACVIFGKLFILDFFAYIVKVVAQMTYDSIWQRSSIFEIVLARKNLGQQGSHTFKVPSDSEMLFRPQCSFETTHLGTWIHCLFIDHIPGLAEVSGSLCLKAEEIQVLLA